MRLDDAAGRTATERRFRTPGCDERCRVVEALVPGVFGRTELLLCSPEAHEAYGRFVASGSVDAPRRVVRTGPLVVDVDGASVALDGRDIWLSPIELRLLLALASRPGVMLEYREIVSSVWGHSALDVAGLAWLHMLRVHTSRLRRRLRAAGGLVQSVYGLGMRLEIIRPGDPLPALRDARSVMLHDRWALAWERCRDCGGTDRQHNGKGLCTRCHARRGRRQQTTEER